jgi:hypothetical protein
MSEQEKSFCYFMLGVGILVLFLYLPWLPIAIIGLGGLYEFLTGGIRNAATKKEKDG